MDCNNCGESIPERNSKYCSRECYLEHVPSVYRNADFSIRVLEPVDIYVTAEEAAANLYRRIKKNVFRGGREVKITKEEIKKQWEKQGGLCYITGISMDLRPSPRGVWNPYKASIDRIDPELPYEPDNIAICCFWANVAKHAFDIEQLIDFCQATVEWNR